MNHLIPHWMDTDNHMKGDPDDFIMPKDDDDGGEGRQKDLDLETEVRRLQEILKKSLKNPLFQKQAD